MARNSVCGVAVPNCRKSDFGPLATYEAESKWPDNRRKSNPRRPPAVEFDEVERRATLFRLVDTLPAEQRRVVVLRFVEQKSIKEVAREIRKTEGAVKQLQFRALSSLRARMEGADA